MRIEEVIWLAPIALQTDPGTVAWSDWGGVITSVAGIMLVIILAGVLIWQVFKTMQTRMTTQAVIAQDQAFRELAERATAAQETIASESARMSAEITEIRSRVTAMEKLLREVE
jgi:predicted negative regulator of RcsB-dependent stress response